MTPAEGAAQPQSPPSLPQKIDWRVWLAIFGLWLAPAVTVSVSPLINTAAMAARDLNEAEIGLVRTLEVLLNASLVIWLSTILPRLKPRQLGLIGVLMISAGNAGGMFGSTMADLIAARLVAGAGAACALSAGAALIARIKSPQRLFGAVSLPITVLGVSSVLIAGYMAKTNGQVAVFGVVAACALFGALFVLFAPRDASAPDQRTGSIAQFLRFIRHPFVLAALFCYIGGTAMWAFFARKGLLLGLESAQIGEIIAAVSVATGLFAVLGAAIRDRWVPYVAVGAVVSYALANATVAAAPSVPIFIAAQTITSFAYVIIQNTLTTASARIDRTGSLTAAGLGWSQLANSTAPAAGGLIITMTGAYEPLSLLILACGALTTFFLILAVRKLPPA